MLKPFFTTYGLFFCENLSFLNEAIMADAVLTEGFISCFSIPETKCHQATYISLERKGFVLAYSNKFNQSVVILHRFLSLSFSPV